MPNGSTQQIRVATRAGSRATAQRLAGPPAEALRGCDPSLREQPKLRPLGGGYALVADHMIPWHDRIGNRRLLVPEGFWSLGRVQRLLRALGPDGAHAEAVLLHDALYGCGGLPPRGWLGRRGHGGSWSDDLRPIARGEADRVFRDLLRRGGVPAWRSWPLYAGIRLLGWTCWRGRGAPGWPRYLGKLKRRGRGR